MASLTDIFPDEPEEDEPIINEDLIEEITDSDNPARDLIDDLVGWLEHGKTEPPRAPGLHCSSLWKTCARKILLETKYADEIKQEVIKAGSRMTFDMGHALHDMMQNNYLGAFKRIWGDWKCLRCQDIVHRGTLPEACPKCDLAWRDAKDGSHNIIYAELFVHSEELDYCGHCDGILLGRGKSPKHRVFEFKTKSKAQFKTLRSPDTSHIVQVHAYMYALDMDEAVILYWDKGSQCDWSRDDEGNWLAGDPHLKAYTVKFDNDLWAQISIRIRDYHKAAKLAQSLPTISAADITKFPRLCTYRKCDLALSCPVSAQCFRLPK